MPIAKIFCTAFGTVLFIYQGIQTVADTECHRWQVAVSNLRGFIRITSQAIPCDAYREPGEYDAESLAMLVVGSR